MKNIVKLWNIVLIVLCFFVLVLLGGEYMVQVNQNLENHLNGVDNLVEHSHAVFILNSPEALIAFCLVALVAIPASVIVPPVVPAEQASNPTQYPCHASVVVFIYKYVLTLKKVNDNWKYFMFF